MGSVGNEEGRIRLEQCLMNVKEGKMGWDENFACLAREVLRECRRWRTEATMESEYRQRRSDVALGFLPKTRLLCDSSDEEETAASNLPSSKEPIKREKECTRGLKRESCADSLKEKKLMEILGGVFSPSSLDVSEEIDKRWQEVVQRLRHRPIAQALRENGISPASIRGCLDRRTPSMLSEIVNNISSLLWNKMDGRGLASDYTRDACQEFIDCLVCCIEEIYKAGLNEKKTRRRTMLTEDGDLPKSILANQLPYLHRLWRKQPFERRLYEYIDSYRCEEDHDELLSRLRSTKSDGCSVDFFRNNSTIDEQELCRLEAALIEAVREKRVLKRDIDVLEVDTWGMDCYSRQNVFDAILDASLPDVDASTIHRWIQWTLCPMINQEKENGWDLRRALNQICTVAGERSLSALMAMAVQERLSLVGEDYFRVHPKGTGVISIKNDGIPPFTLVEEYLGVLHAPWRWFEIQDILKRQNPDEVPDFYNIILERPRKDPAGFEVTFVDAAAKGTFASRMSHSCDPNCQVTVLSVDGRLTIAMYTTKAVLKGQELTFDYSSVTESEKEYRSAICLCASHICRGSFLHYAGSGAFMHIMSCKHHFLHRNALLIRAATEKLTQEDRSRLNMHGLREACLGRHGVDRVPSWLEKWASLILEYIEMEHRLLPEALHANAHNSPTITSLADAHEHAKGVKENRLQNIVITIDKIRMCLKQKSQPIGPPLVPLSDDEMVRHLWSGDNSIAKRFFKAFLRVSVPSEIKKHRKERMTPFELEKLGTRLQEEHPSVAKVCFIMSKDAPDSNIARQNLLDIECTIRHITTLSGSLHTAAADILYLYAHTQTFFQPGQHYKGFTSKPLKMHLSNVSGAHLPRVPSTERDSSDGSTDMDKRNKSNETCHRRRFSHLQCAVMCRIKDPYISKKYSAHFIWGQLVMWYKQTVNDPTASLSAERRGSLSLPDIESCYHRGHGSYTSRDRKNLLEQLQNRPDAMWKVGTIFTFKNEAKVYGSPMLDSVLSHQSMTEILQRLT